MIKEQWGPKTVHLYFFPYFFFYQAKGHLGLCHLNFNSFYRYSKKKNKTKPKQTRKNTHKTSEYFICFLINSRFVNLLFANILSHFTNMLGQFPNFTHLNLWLKQRGVHMCMGLFCVIAKRIRYIYVWCSFCVISKTT